MGFGFIEYRNREAAEHAIKVLQVYLNIMHLGSAAHFRKFDFLIHVTIMSVDFSCSIASKLQYI